MAMMMNRRNKKKAISVYNDVFVCVIFSPKKNPKIIRKTKTD